MPFVFSMPKLSPTMEEGMIARWLKKEGDFVKAGEPLLEIATDKATVESSSLDEGWLRKILLPQGKSGTINTPLALFSETKDEDINAFLESLLAKKAPEKERGRRKKQLQRPSRGHLLAPSRSSCPSRLLRNTILAPSKSAAKSEHPPLPWQEKWPQSRVWTCCL